MVASSEWPIYRLADYERSGSLLELARLVLPEVDRPPEVGEPPNLQSIEWWRLADCEGLEEAKHRRPLVQLAQALNELLSPYLAPNPTRSLHGGGSLPTTATQEPNQEPWVVTAKSEFLGSARSQSDCGHRGASTISAAGDLRRSCWRLRWPEQKSPTKNGSTFSVEKEGDQLGGWLSAEGLAPRRDLIWSRRVECRGKYGESLVHILMVNHTNHHLLLLLLVLRLWPRLLGDLFESRKLAGLGCLHLAVAHDNQRLLDHLLRLDDSKKLLEQQATGSLFRVPERLVSRQLPSRNEIKRVKSAPKGWWRRSWSGRRVGAAAEEPSQSHEFWCDSAPCWPAPNGHAHLLLFDRLPLAASGDNKESNQVAYLGSTALAWSVCLNRRWAYERLVEAGSDQDARDPMGHTCLHLLALNDLGGWARFLAKSGARLNLRDSRGLTPLLLACRLGRHKLFEELLELSSAEFWSYSSVRCSGYPLAQLDSLLAGGRSALAVMLESDDSNDEQKARLLASGPVERLLEEKWRHYARRLFFHELALALVQLLFLTLAISLRPPPSQTSSTSASATSAFQSNLELIRRHWLRHLAELLAWLLACLQLARFAGEWRRYRDVRLQWTYNPLLPNHVVAQALILLCAPARLVRRNQLEDVMLVFAAPLLWSSLLFFIAAFRVTGPFVAMIRYMLVRDLRQFSLIYLVFLYAFAQCLFFVNQANNAKNQEQDEQDSQLGQYLALWMELFKMTLGVYDLQPFRHSALARLFFLLFIYLIPILFNMLIAMMNNTYSLIISQSERAWSFQWARTLFALERRLGERQQAAHLRQYSINMPAASSTCDDDNDDDKDLETNKEEAKFVPALVIIKRMDWTRAERKRRLAAHWQRAIRCTLAEAARRRHLLAAA